MAPKTFSLCGDPFERREREAGGRVPWFVGHARVLLPAQRVAEHLAIFRELPPRQRPGSFSNGKVMKMLMETNRIRESRPFASTPLA